MIRELDVVALKRDIPGTKGIPDLRAGDVGTVVQVYTDEGGYELEFTTPRGETLAVITVPADAVRMIGPPEGCSLRHRRLVN